MPGASAMADFAWVVTETFTTEGATFFTTGDRLGNIFAFSTAGASVTCR